MKSVIIGYGNAGVKAKPSFLYQKRQQYSMKWNHEGLHIGGYIINKKLFPLILILTGIALLALIEIAK